MARRTIARRTKLTSNDEVERRAETSTEGSLSRPSIPSFPYRGCDTLLQPNIRSPTESYDLKGQPSIDQRPDQSHPDHFRRRYVRQQPSLPQPKYLDRTNRGSEKHPYRDEHPKQASGAAAAFVPIH